MKHNFQPSKQINQSIEVPQLGSRTCCCGIVRMNRLLMHNTGRHCLKRALHVHVQAARANVAPKRSQPSSQSGTAERSHAPSRDVSYKARVESDIPSKLSGASNRRRTDRHAADSSDSSRDPPRAANRTHFRNSRGLVNAEELNIRPPVRARDVLLKKRPQATQNQQSQQQQADASQMDPTFVPRNPAVIDGPWNKIDEKLVAMALQDSHSAGLSAADADAAAAAQHLQQQQQQQQLNPSGQVLLGQTPEQLSILAQQLGQPAYRGKQLAEGLAKGVRRISDIKGLPKTFVQELESQGVRIGRSIVHHRVKAPDGTVKLLLQLEEGRVIETVGIPVDEEGKQRLTVCVSSQVGCPMRCTFCATGKGGFARNLRAHEIIDQVLTISEEFGGQRVTNVVFMGMGEPLLNISNVTAAVGYLQSQLNMSGRSITISTVGLPNAIRKLAQHNLTATLAVSIHAPDQQLREQLIPSAKVYPISALMSDCAHYFQTTKRRVTFEYTLMAGTNDATQHAEKLASLLRRHNLVSHVNLIPWNPVDESDYRRPSRDSVTLFQKVLEDAGLPVSVRSTRGLEAAAACGQLRNRYQKEGLQNPQPLA